MLKLHYSSLALFATNAREPLLSEHELGAALRDFGALSLPLPLSAVHCSGDRKLLEEFRRFCIVGTHCVAPLCVESTRLDGSLAFRIGELLLHLGRNLPT